MFDQGSPCVLVNFLYLQHCKNATIYNFLLVYGNLVVSEVD